jgi:hypothetical protein
MEQDSVVEIDVLAEASGDEVRLGEVVTDPEHGTVSIVDGTVVYTPGEGFTGEDSFQVTVVDTWGNSVVVTVTVIVAPFEDVPLVSAGVGLAGLALAGLALVGLGLVGLGGAGYRVARTRRPDPRAPRGVPTHVLGRRQGY